MSNAKRKPHVWVVEGRRAGTEWEPSMYAHTTRNQAIVYRDRVCLREPSGEYRIVKYERVAP